MKLPVTVPSLETASVLLPAGDDMSASLSPILDQAPVAPSVDAALPFVGVDEALTALQSHRGPVLVDLDETLYLRNSTEDFLDCAAPGWLALLVLRVLDVLKPWRWTGGELTRDAWRVGLVGLLLPWTALRWRRRVQAHAERHSNRSLMSALLAREQAPIIVTSGFCHIVLPLISAMGLAGVRVVAARGLRDRRVGKLVLCEEALGPEVIAGSLVITDSPTDMPLLQRCGVPVLTRWPQARFRPALRSVYLPGQYLTQVKRPGERYIVRGILQEDFAFWLLTSIGFATLPLLHVLGLLCLLLSFWAIYERGYVDNDEVAARYEAKPKLSDAFRSSPVATPRWQPWIWAAVFGAAGILLIHGAEKAPMLLLQDALLWAAVLVGTYNWFLLYNRHDKTTRVWLFPGLHFARSASFALMVEIGPVGAVALAAHVIARWMPYYLYRHADNGWPDTSLALARLLFFTIGILLLAMAQGPELLLTAPAIALIGWNLYRARQDLQEVFRNARRIDREEE